VPDHWERYSYDRTLIDMPGARLDLLEPLGDTEYEVLPGIVLIERPAIPVASSRQLSIPPTTAR